MGLWRSHTPIPVPPFISSLVQRYVSYQYWCLLMNSQTIMLHEILCGFLFLQISSLIGLKSSKIEQIWCLSQYANQTSNILAHRSSTPKIQRQPVINAEQAHCIASERFLSVPLVFFVERHLTVGRSRFLIGTRHFQWRQDFGVVAKLVGRNEALLEIVHARNEILQGQRRDPLWRGGWVGLENRDWSSNKRDAIYCTLVTYIWLNICSVSIRFMT